MSNKTRKIGTCSFGRHVACINGKQTRLYGLWSGMITRCYYGSNTAYIGCEVDPRFLEFQDFADWAVQQIGFDILDFELDKDILSQGRKVYSPENCVFVPSQINSLFTGSRSSKNNTQLGVKYIEYLDSYRTTLRGANGESISKRSKYLEECIAFFKEKKIQVVKEVATKWKEQIDPRVYEKLSNITEEQLLAYFAKAD